MALDTACTVTPCSFAAEERLAPRYTETKYLICLMFKCPPYVAPMLPPLTKFYPSCQVLRRECFRFNLFFKGADRSFEIGENSLFLTRR